MTDAEPAAGAVAEPAAENNHSTSAELEDRSRREPVVGTTEVTLVGAAVAVAPGRPLPDPQRRRPQERAGIAAEPEPHPARGINAKTYLNLAETHGAAVASRRRHDAADPHAGRE